MNRVLALLLVLLLTVAATASPALAQLGPNVPAPLTTPAEELVPGPEEEDTGITTRQIILIFGGAIGVLAIIAWFIMRDARGAAPPASPQRGNTAYEPSASGSAKSAAKSARERERERARKRSKAKAVRDQRKRNRPR